MKTQKQPMANIYANNHKYTQSFNIISFQFL